MFATQRKRKRANKANTAHNWGRLGQSSGFTLIEIIIVIATIVFVYSVALPQFSLRTGSEIASKIGRLVSDIRNAYDLAVLSGKNYRLVINFISGDYWLEEADQKDIVLGDEKGDHDPTDAEEKERIEVFDERFKEYEDLAGETFTDPATDEEIKPVSPVVQAKDKLRPPKWTKVTAQEWSSRTIGPFLIFQDVQAEHHKEKQTADDQGKDARAFIYFFPSGYVEKSVIHIAYRVGDSGVDTDKPPYTISVDPSTGTSDVVSSYEEVDVHKSDDQKADF